ncbi:periplasmic binding protein/LacI transcriptional regulator [Bifidobacterium stellenboschense]|uniref:Periplasmic binding protein/LacI transcriptional regulator n=2 Tax=Bifidobacterium stellenboschense TaxID=762211 RepID=A0A087DIS8_9BIFI|nr:periplasmic binding protein/LacI transcriptional regulator [Bifidobacterium stellenboschense]
MDDERKATNGKVTIRDVARAAGVNPSTVSRAFARPGRVNVDTAKRIFAVADELGYRSETVHSYPTSGDGGHLNGLIAFVVADLANPIYAELVKSAQHQCLRKGFGLLVIDSEESGALEQNALRQTNVHIDGIVLASSRLSDSAVRKMAETKPVITINRSVRGVQSVIADTHEGIAQAVKHLDELGHASITYLSGPAASWQDGIRWRALTAACEARHIRLRRIMCPNPTFSGGYRCYDAYAKNPTTAVIGYNDLEAIGFIAALKAHQVAVPQQVSVIGIDDTPISALTTPALTTIRLPRRQMGEAAVQELISRLLHTAHDHTMVPIRFATTLVNRASTAEVDRLTAYAS